MTDTFLAAIGFCLPSNDLVVDQLKLDSAIICECYSPDDSSHESAIKGWWSIRQCGDQFSCLVIKVIHLADGIRILRLFERIRKHLFYLEL